MAREEQPHIDDDTIKISVAMRKEFGMWSVHEYHKGFVVLHDMNRLYMMAEKSGEDTVSHRYFFNTQDEARTAQSLIALQVALDSVKAGKA